MDGKISSDANVSFNSAVHLNTVAPRKYSCACTLLHEGQRSIVG